MTCGTVIGLNHYGFPAFYIRRLIFFPTFYINIFIIFISGCAKRGHFQQRLNNLENIYIGLRKTWFTLI